MKTSFIVAGSILLATTLHAALDAPIVETPEVMQKAATFGDAIEQYRLARAYLEGTAVPKDVKQAQVWLRKAAMAGVASAQYDLGVLLSNGTDVPADDKEAARWFFAAAQNGVFEAQAAMVRVYATGRGVEKSPAKALAWDMIARRTIELNTGLSAGLPPKPGTVRSDGAAETVDKDGHKLWTLPDGSVETLDESGRRHIDHKSGAKTTVEKDGSWETVYPQGLRQSMTTRGCMTFTDSKGNQDIYEPDGTHAIDSGGRAEDGTFVRIHDTFGLDGKRLSHRVKAGETTYVELADGSKKIETECHGPDRVPMILTEDVDADGKQVNGKLRRAEGGVGPKGSEIWEIQRTLHLVGNEVAVVTEKYSEFGRYSQEVVSRRVEAPLVADRRSSMMPLGPVPSGAVPVTVEKFVGTTMSAPIGIGMSSAPSSGIEDPTAFATKPDIEPRMAILMKMESTARNFVGAKDADYASAQAAAQTYLIPLVQPPQKPTAAPAWLREKTISTTTMHEFNLVAILNDRSSAVPFGPYGTEIIKQLPWKHAESDHFIVHFVGEAEAKLTLQYIEGVYTVLTQLLNLDPQRGATKSHVFIFPEAAWSDFKSSHQLPTQVAGFAYRTELLLGANASEKGLRLESIKVISHEVTHALVSRFYPSAHPPLWLNEGLADYIALRTMRSKGTLQPAKGTAEAGGTPQEKERARMEAIVLRTPDKPIDIQKVFTRVRYGSRTSPDRLVAFYANSEKAVETLFEKLPLENFPRFFNLIVAGNEPGISLSTAYGKQCDGIAAFGNIVNTP